MFESADAPSPKGWSKRQANAKARLAKRDAMNALSAVRQRYYVAVKAGFPTIEAHEAHLAAVAAMDVMKPVSIDLDMEVETDSDVGSGMEAEDMGAEDAPMATRKPRRGKAKS